MQDNDLLAGIAGILVSNALSLALAAWQGWSPLLLLWTFWMQSVAIGWTHYRRIKALQRFSTDGLRYRGHRVPADETGRNRVARFFARHYGGFHACYFAFLAIATTDAVGTTDVMGHVPMQPPTLLDLALTLGVGLTFFTTQHRTLRRQLASDARKTPNLGRMFFMPYARVVPMHVTMGMAWKTGAVGSELLTFCVLKTIADVAMHVTENRRLEKAGSVSIG